MANDGTAGDLVLWEDEIAKYLVHERRRLHLVAAVLLVMGALLGAGHLFADLRGHSFVPWGLEDVIAGFPTALAIAVAAGGTLSRALMLARVSRRWSLSGGRSLPSHRFNET